MPKPKQENINTVIIKGISVSIVFFVSVVIIIAAMFLFSIEGEFLGLLSGRVNLSLTFYISTVAVIIFSSLMFTPFSFGISYYFINSKAGTGSFLQIFYLFKRPRLMFKAIAMNTVKKLIINIYKVVTLILAVVAECGIFVISIVVSGENIFDYENNFFESVISFMSNSEFFIILTIIEWALVICTFFYFKIKFIICKYVLIANPAVGPIEAVRIGKFAISGLVFKTVLFYLKYLSIYIFTFITLGLSDAVDKNKTRESFSTYALRVASNGISAYYERRERFSFNC